ncbi:riboflavin synthase [Desulfuromonas sp. AOP6]|uniref:riboflavin synthase n=1 Tax=Desulfuromonas sp. AOP6 TaxID=1566351 RepID=UPI001277C98C|nr:riboflavin synthase [Desulfuromonas sp. AOP6]BCA79807.1 riboflavin synthase subunit alpha [Desulfuromonas sp. AOP6]
MFTGLIQDVGTLLKIHKGGASFQLTVSTHFPLDDLSIGESIAVNGICLTLVSRGGGAFSADVSRETVMRTNLADLRVGQRVNLERALMLSDRLGGHIVTGHVDGIGVIRSKTLEGNAERIVISIPDRCHRYMVVKGSVAVDGISLTVNDVTEEDFSLMIIPHSLSRTTLQYVKPGDRVNVETDILGKYVERLLGSRGEGQKSQAVNFEFLANHGFM